MLVLGSLVSLRDHPIVVAWSICAVLFTVAVSCSFMWLYFRNTRLSFDGSRVSYTNWRGSVRSWGTADIGYVIFAPYYVVIMQSRRVAVPSLFLLVTKGARLLRLSSRWSGDDMEAFVKALGGESEIISREVTSTQIRQRYPEAVRWWE